MARIRSPNYPSMGLPEAIAKIKTIHEREQHLSAPREVMAKHLGYAGINGSSLKALSSLLKYGLLEKTKDEQRKVTDLALKILHPQNPAEKVEAIQEAASKPALFVEIANQWPNGIPSDENLKSWLIRQNFAVDAIPEVIKSYRETRELVAADSELYTAPKPGPEAQVEPAINRTDPPHPLAVEGASQHAFEGLDLGKINNFSIVDQGSVIHVRGTVDRKGLDRLLKKLTAYKAVLDAAADDEENENTKS